MEGLWRMYRHRGETGHSHLQDPLLFHLCYVSDHGVPRDRLYDPRLLDEYEELYPQRQKKSPALPLIFHFYRACLPQTP